jgi:ribonuclease BN (tRNA processing enzyme)
VIVFTGDTGPNEALVELAEGHLSTDDVGKMATRAGVNTVVLTHLTWKADDDYSTWADEVKKHFSGHNRRQQLIALAERH